ncbi:protein phosphatase 1 regulatory subunit 21 isoform X2 [Agrilus planipennis]|uniref:Protein phosphatase 1 regulatory subunit 21 isoform X2 n=1 Tax=Agrilus planipennis TaxID=224129 RepID=A0A1W4X8P7_AGRPL|nr:protein phosphatase 1 regulatory subunit 21 isoform X2 [Agrilus planipennis]
METAATELEIKYQKLASEYSKARSQVTVLKKAVLDEQAKTLELREVIKECEQKLRKHDQEMDSLTFRNEQLLKRIAVLQQDLQSNNSGKKSKTKNSEVSNLPTLSVFDEELQKKILENAQLMSAMADKEIEIQNNKEKIFSLEKKVAEMQLEIKSNNEKHLKEIEKFERNQKDETTFVQKQQHLGQGDAKMINYWQTEAERWKNECEVLRAKPESNGQLTQYYENQIREIFELKQLAQSEASSLWAENAALASRLEGIVIENNENNVVLEKRIEELNTTEENYKSQLDAMTEHLAAQNEKITKLSDEVQLLKHKLTIKK